MGDAPLTLDCAWSVYSWRLKQTEIAMQVRLISHPFAQLARLVGLVRRVEPARLEGGKEWGLLIRGRGFNRLLDQELLDAPGLLRPAGWATPRPITFRSKKAAVRYAQGIGLSPGESGVRLARDA